jgi:hypothetical protein
VEIDMAKLSEIKNLSSRIRLLNYWIQNHIYFEKQKSKLLENTDTDKLLLWSILQQNENSAQSLYKNTYYISKLEERNIAIDQMKKFIVAKDIVIQGIDAVKVEFHEMYYDGPYPQKEIDELELEIKNLKEILYELRQDENKLNGPTEFLKKIEREVNSIRRELENLNSNWLTEFSLPDEYTVSGITMSFV